MEEPYNGVSNTDLASWRDKHLKAAVIFHFNADRKTRDIMQVKRVTFDGKNMG